MRPGTTPPAAGTSCRELVLALVENRGLTLRAVASKAHCDPSLLSKVLRGTRTGTSQLMRRVDTALNANGAVLSAWMAERGTRTPGQLPPAPTVLVGRSAQLAALDDAVDAQTPGTPTLIVVEGPAGSGKTSVVLRWAHMAGERGHYPDGQLYADLGGFGPDEQRTTPRHVLQWFCNALGSTEQPDHTADLASLFRSLVAHRRMLIVLDNALTAEDVIPLLPGSASCTVVVTSRRVLSTLTPLRYDGRRLTIDALSPTDSLKLLEHLIGAERVHPEHHAALDIAHMCSYLPLALRVAAIVATTYSHRSLHELADDLRPIPSRLDYLDTDGVTAVHTALSWTYRTLAPEEKTLFRALGVRNEPSFTVAAAAQLTGADIPATERILQRLAGLHLVRVVPDPRERRTQYTLDDLLRSYAHQLNQREADHRYDDSTRS